MGQPPIFNWVIVRLVSYTRGKSLGNERFYFFQGQELVTIYENSFASYWINEKTMFRYAGRRKIAKELRAFIHNRTNIELFRPQETIERYPINPGTKEWIIGVREVSPKSAPILIEKMIMELIRRAVLIRVWICQPRALRTPNADIIECV